MAAAPLIAESIGERERPMTQSIWTRLDTLTPGQIEKLLEKLRVTTQEVLVGRLAREGISQGELASRVGRSSSWTSKIKKLDAYDLMSIGLFGAGVGIKLSDAVTIAEEVIDAELDRGIFTIDDEAPESQV